MTDKSRNFTQPRFPILSDARVGVLPNSAHVGAACNALYQHCRNHWGQGQIYTYSAPGVTWNTNTAIAPDYDYDWQDQRWAVILSSPPKADTSHPYRRLGGLFAPWRAVPYFDEAYGTVTVPSRITWQADYGDVTGEQTVWQSTQPEPSGWWNAQRLNSGLGDGNGVTWHELYNFSGPNLAHNSDMSGDMVHWYTAGNGAILSKSTAYVREGHSHSLYVQRNSTDNPYAIPSINGHGTLSPGSQCKCSVWARRNDASAVPRILNGDGTVLSTGATISGWQLIETDWFVVAGNHIRLESYQTIPTSSRSAYFSDLVIKEKGKLSYRPQAEGLFTVGFLRAYRMKVASICLWSMPDSWLYDEQAEMLPEHVRANECIRGHQASTRRKSIGFQQHRRAYGGILADDGYHDDLERNTRRCLFQSGHPIGISTESESYVNIRGGYDSSFPAIPRNLLGLSDSGTVPSYPAFYASGEGTIELTSVHGGSTFEIAVDGEGLYYDLSQIVSLRATGDYVKIRFKAASASRVVIHTYSLWEGEYAL